MFDLGEQDAGRDTEISHAGKTWQAEGKRQSALANTAWWAIHPVQWERPLSCIRLCSLIVCPPRATNSGAKSHPITERKVLCCDLLQVR